jgi:hypothetical protein
MFSNTTQMLKKRTISWTSKVYFYLFLFFIFSTTTTYAQCAMCRAALTSEGNKTKAEAVNDGIVYLMVIPYLLVGGIGYAIYRMKKK